MNTKESLIKPIDLHLLVKKCKGDGFLFQKEIYMSCDEQIKLFNEKNEKYYGYVYETKFLKDEANKFNPKNN